MPNAKLWFTGLLIAALLASPDVARAARTAEPTVDPGDVALAERLAETARLTLAARYLTKAQHRMAGALLEAANKLAPDEPRFSRLWADALLQAGDNPGAIRALKAYLKTAPDDRTAMIQLIDLHAASFETMDRRLDYLLELLDTPKIPEEVRSHVAFVAYQVCIERLQMPKAKKLLDQALVLNPLNMEALHARFDQVVAEGTTYDRVAVLLQILRANPASAPTMQRLGQELASVGLVQGSLQFYTLSFNVSNRMGMQIPPDAVVSYVTELLVVNQAPAAKSLVDQLVIARPADYEPLALRLMIERATDQKEAAPKTLLQLQKVFANRLQLIRKEGFGNKAATTRPVDSPDAVDWGSPGDDVRQLKELPQPEADRVRPALVSTFTEIAWLETYFREAPGDAKPFIDALHQLLPDDDATLARLEGWGFLFRGEKDQAVVKLSAVKDKDVLAELGLVRLMDPAASKVEGDKLLSRHPVGLTALTILDALRDRKVALMTNPEVVTPFVQLMNKFDAPWMTFLDQPQVFYSLAAEPVRQSVDFGVPMLVRVTIKNVSDYPISVGPEGALHPDLWFEADFRGIVKQNVPFAAYDRLTHVVVLRPHTSVSQVVRIDQGQMSQFLTSSPFPAMQIVLKVKTNPSTTGQNALAPGGQSAPMGKSIERSSFSYAQASLQQMAKALQTAGPAERMAKIDLAATVALLLSQQPAEEAKRTSASLVELLNSGSRDPSPAVAIWAATTLARVSGGNERVNLIKRLLNDPNPTARLLGLATMGPIRMEDQRAVAQQLAAKDTDRTVVAYAKALDELLAEMIAARAASATQPSSTQPSATQPSTTQPGTELPIGPTVPTTFNPVPPEPATKPAVPPLVIPPLPKPPEENKP